MKVGTLFTTVKSEPVRVAAGFWRRLIAFMIDAIIVSVPCYILGFAFFSFFSHSPAWAILIGFAITLLYFAVLGSSIGGGQTLGYRATQIQVVNKDGDLLSPVRSLIRYAIFLIPLLSSEIFPTSTPFALRTSFQWLLGAMAFAIIYLYIFNVRTRQSLHDIATGAFVVDKPFLGRLEARPMWLGHWLVVGSIALAAAIFPFYQVGPLAELTSIQRAIPESDKLRVVEVILNKNWANGQTSTGIQADVSWRGKPDDYEKAAREIAASVLKADPRAAERDFISVRFVQGFRIGFATFGGERSISDSPKGWMELIHQAGTNP